MEIRCITAAAPVLALWQALSGAGLRVPMLATAAQLEANLVRRFAHPQDFVLGAYEGGQLVGAFSFSCEPEQRYLELMAAVCDSEAACAAVLAHLKTTHPGWTLDAVYHPAHAALEKPLAAMGALLYPVQLAMRRPGAAVASAALPAGVCVTPIRPGHHPGYTALHETDCYWTAHRVLAAPHIFRVLVAVQADAVLGYIDYTYKNEPNEVYDLVVSPAARRQGIGRALLAAALADTRPRAMGLVVDEDNAAARRLYEGLGFAYLAGAQNRTAHLTL